MKFDYQWRYGEEHHGYKLFASREVKSFHWDILTMCNYHCEYCYSRAEEDMWNKISNKKMLQETLDKLDEINSPIEIIILGGEPVLHPNYFWLMDNVYAMGDKLKVMGIISNGSLSKFKTIEARQEFILKHEPYKDKFHFNFSMHPRDIEDIDEFLANAKFVQDSGFIINVNIMMVGVDQDERIRKVLTFCEEHNIRYVYNVLFNPQTLEDYQHLEVEYKDWVQSINNDFSGYKDMHFVDGGKDGTEVAIYNDLDVYLNKVNEFKGWKCMNSNYIVPVGGSKFIRFCSEDTWSVDEINADDGWMDCPLVKCLCQGLMSNEKIKY